MSCIFCGDHHQLPDVGEVVYENDVCSVVLHADWAVRGHAMVISKRHVENVCDLTDEEARRYLAVERAAETVLLELTGTERALLVKLGIAVPHLHLHIYPMRATDDRATFQAAFDMKTRVPRDEAFVKRVRDRLASASS